MSSPSICRLYPDFSRARGLLLDEASSVRVLRHQRGGAEQVGRLAGVWTAGREVPLGDFPCAMGFAPIFSRRLCERFERELGPFGRFIPVDAEGVEEGAYQLYLVEPMIDCLDVERSDRPRRSTGEMRHLAFLPSRIDPSIPAFRIPQSPAFAFWSAAFVSALQRAGASGVQSLVVWSEDRSIQPAPAPMR